LLPDATTRHLFSPFFILPLPHIRHDACFRHFRFSYFSFDIAMLTPRACHYYAAMILIAATPFADIDALPFSPPFCRRCH
jgi:hypothetical protein